MDALLAVDDNIKLKLVKIWKTMAKRDREHFINQVALALSVWGADERGKRMAVEVFRLMVKDGSNSLSDFGLYVGSLLDNIGMTVRREKIARAASVLDRYRAKYCLSSQPYREII